MNYTATKHSTVEDKNNFKKQFIRFVENGFKWGDFTNDFYHRLMTCFGHIAHFNRAGFHAYWFQSSEAQLRWVEHIIEYVPVGDPAFTFSDVETDLRKWLWESGLLERMEADKNVATEAAERAELARLQAKYQEKKS